MPCLAVGLLALVLLPGRGRPSSKPSREPAMPQRSPAECPPDVLDLIAARQAEEEKHGYPCVAFEFPFLACPRAEFDEVLARHDAAVRAHLGAILFLARKELHFREPYDWIERCAAEIDLHGGRPPPRLVVRSSISTARRFRSFLSVHHRSFGYPGKQRMRVAVIDEDAVSLRKLELRTEKLPSGALRRELVAVTDEPLTFEPVRQEQRQEASNWVRTWRATATSPVHEERIAIRPPAQTQQEWIDRLFAANEGRLRRRAAIAQKDGAALNQLLLWLTLSDEFSSCANVASNTRQGWAPFVLPFPKSHEVVWRPWPRGWLPTLVTWKESFGGIRWLSLGPEADPQARPADTTERKEWAVWREVKRARGW
jgi:hypothetical protein